MLYPWTALLVTLWTAQIAPLPAYVIEGDRVETQFRSYREDLDRFHGALRDVVDQRAPGLFPDVRDRRPPDPVVYGYRLLPPIDGSVPRDVERESLSVRSYSWSLTRGYIDDEREKLRRALLRLSDLESQRGIEGLSELVDQYEELVDNQETIDQHIQYNRFWQRSVAENRPRFDQLNEVYDLMLAGDAEMEDAIRGVLGEPGVPTFVTVTRQGGSVVVRLPVDTDIVNATYLDRLEAAAEGAWRASDGAIDYRLDVEFRSIAPGVLYLGEDAPSRGEHIDLPAHLARFGPNRAVLTTGAESTHAFVGRAVLLGTGALTTRTFAHEIGHLLGFRDGYLRAYSDLGSQGFEIRELTSRFDDIMTAPRSGSVTVEHFELVVGGIGE